jgi:hypothetical protein
MFDSFFIKIISDSRIIELDTIVTSNLLDFEFKFIFRSLAKPLNMENIFDLSLRKKTHVYLE